MTIVCVGECMLELSRGPSHGHRLGFGGDTFNTAVYLARFGNDVAYLTALGGHPYSDEMREAWAAEGLDPALVLTDPDRLPGLYAIRTDAAGERSFFYWRALSAVRNLFNLPGIEAALATAAQARLLYLSGITLALFEAEERRRLLKLAEAVRAAGGDVAFDPNYRPSLWADAATARSAMSDFAGAVSMTLPTFSDERELHGDVSPERTAERWVRLGAREVVVKLGAEGCLIADATAVERLTAPPVDDVVETTGAGDSFNAGYLDARLRMASTREAAELGAAVAGAVIRRRGAIVDIAPLGKPRRQQRRTGGNIQLPGMEPVDAATIVRGK